MKYNLELIIDGRVIQQKKVKRRGTLSKPQLTDFADQMYFRFVDGPKGPSYYPEALFVVKTPSDGKVRKFLRSQGSNSAGFSNLWREQQTERPDPVASLLRTLT